MSFKCEICGEIIEGPKIVVPLTEPLFYHKECFYSQDEAFFETQNILLDKET